MRAVSSGYLRLLIFLPAILIPACASSSLAFHMTYSAYKLNKHADNIHSWPISFPIWNLFIFPCLVLTATSWPAYTFLRRQVRWSGIPISLTIFQFVVIHIVKTFSIVSEVYVFLSYSISQFNYPFSCSPMRYFWILVVIILLETLIYHLLVLSCKNFSRVYTYKWNC